MLRMSFGRKRMKHTTAVCTLALTSALAFAQTNPQDHSVHHAEGAASAPAASAPSAPAQAAAPDNFGRQMQMMEDMHKRMQVAKSPAEKQALLAEHTKLMQSGMEMMSQMRQGSGMGMMGGMGGSPGAGMQGKPPGRPNSSAMGGMNGMMDMHGAMERRMAMMEQMMQMMVDREAAMPRR
jgi:hypothetical protein